MQPQISRSELTLPVTTLLPENPLPRFSEAPHRTFRDSGLLPEEQEGVGQHTGFRVLPYRMQDRYAATPTVQTIPTVVLENENLRATFLPGYGGRLYSLWDKQKSRECLYCNKGIIIRNLALRNAWFSGGIEWNFGHYGHTFFTCQDVFFASCTDEKGAPFLRMYEYERCKQMTFQVDFHLPEGADALTAHFSVYNDHPMDTPIFLWTNTALPQETGMHVYSGTREVIALRAAPELENCSYFHGALPHLFSSQADASDPTTLKCSTEYFFQNPPQVEDTFEAVRYADGRLFAERSTGNYPYRKMFCWGTHTGGSHWQRFLASGDSGDYLEVQAGLARTQVHPYVLAAKSILHITQQFTMADEPMAPTGGYDQARSQIQARVAQLLPVSVLEEMHVRASALSSKPADSILHVGFGWGALEKDRCIRSLPQHLDFPSTSITEDQRPWLALLYAQPMDDCPSYMVAEPWLLPMERVEVKNAALWIHLGIVYLENSRPEDARHAWEEALRLEPLPLPMRNLAQLCRREGDLAAAQTWMEKALALLSDDDSLRPYAEEYLALLAEQGQHVQAFSFYRSLSPALQSEESMRLCVAVSAFHAGEETFLEELFASEFSVVREGERSLTDLWFLWTAQKEANKQGIPLSDELLREVKRTVVLPPRLDFRMA